MGETYVKGDLLAKRGTPLIDDTNDLCPGNVGGQIIGIPFVGAVTASGTSGSLYVGDVATTVTQICMPKAGSVVGLSVQAKTAVAAGHVTFTLVKGATDGTLSIALTTVTGSTLRKYTWVNKDLHTFAAGKNIGITFDSATTNTANKFAAVLWAEI